MNISKNKNCNIKINGKGINQESAKEMFKKLNYKITKDDVHFLVFKSSTFISHQICFCKEQEVVEIRAFINKQINYFSRIDKELIQAINQQCKELGWIDD